MSARAWVYFVAVSILWGIPYLLIKVAVENGIPPAFLAWARVVLGAVVLMGIAWRASVLRGLRGRGRWLVAFAVAEIVVPFPLIAWGEQHVDSSLAAILIAASPLFLALLALRFDATEGATGQRLAGLALGFLGVMALVGVDVAGRRGGELRGAAAILVATFCYAAGPLILKHHLADLDLRASMGASLVVASLLLAPAAFLAPPTAWPSTAAMGALLALGLLCTAAAMVFFGALIAEVGPGRALVITYVNPVVAVVLGMAILGERPGPGAAVGLALILVGSWLSTRRGPPIAPSGSAVEVASSSCP